MVVETYSQNGEDLIISDYFGDYTGHLLDIGANEGVTFSNSRLFLLGGWSGVLVEPSLAFGKLQELYKDNESVALHNVAVGTIRGKIGWYELEDSLLSTTDIKLAIRRGHVITEKECILYSDVADNYDFISIDAEGEDWNILKQINLVYTKCLCIEYGSNEAEITKYCTRFGMRILHRNGENLIFVK